MQEPINLFDPGIRANPYPTYARLRLGGGVEQIQPGGFWAVTRHADVEHVLKSPQIFCSTGFEAFFKPDWLPRNPLGDSLVTKDGPAHAKLRSLVSRAFTPRAIARLEAHIRAIAVELTDRLATIREGDFIEELCALMPGLVTADILGLDRALHRHFKRWVTHIAMVSPVYPGDELASAIHASMREMEAYFRDIIAARRSEPGDDFVSDLVRAEVDGHTLTDDELLAFLFLLLPAGYETTSHLFALTLMDFAARPEQYARLREDPSLIPGYVEEALRKEPPVHGVLRMTTCETELGGVKLPAGSMVLVLLGSANRDESRFPDPERFDPSRGQAGMAFGHGAHFCLGAPLARLEARVLFEELVARFRGFERLPGELEYNAAFHVRGPLSLPMRAIPLQSRKAEISGVESSPLPG